MASVALGVGGAVVGNMILPGIGGVIGGAIGGTLGGFLDSLMFQKKINVPQLADLNISSATYGMPIPRIYGTARVPGELIYCSQLAGVAQNESSGGKGGGGSPTVTTTNYYVNCAVGICAGPITAVLRVWANGNVIYDARDVSYDGSTLGGSSTQPYNPTRMDFFLGAEDQAVSTGMENFVGTGKAPAFRGLAYMIVSRFFLTPYGNAFPSLSFEVVGITNQTYIPSTPLNLMSLSGLVNDVCTQAGVVAPLAGTYPLGDWHTAGTPATVLDPILPVSTLLGDWHSGAPTSYLALGSWNPLAVDTTALSTQMVAGYAITGQSAWHDIITPLQQVFFFDGVESDWKIKFNFQSGTSVGTLSENDLGARSEKVGTDAAKVTVTRAPDLDLPQYLVLRYSAPELAYQTGTQHVQRPAATMKSGQITMFDVPLVMNSGDAKAACEQGMYLAWTGRMSFKFTMPRTMLIYDPGDTVTLTYNDGTTTVPVYLQQTDYGADETIEVTGVAINGATFTPAKSVTPFQTSANGSSVEPLGSTAIIFDPPTQMTDNGDVETWVMAWQVAAAWAGATVYISFDNETWVPKGVITVPARAGTLTSAFAAGSDPDTTHTLAVNLAYSSGELASVSSAVADQFATMCLLDTGANAELIAYSAVTNTSPFNYSMGTYIRRGIYETNKGVTHAVGSQFVRLDANAICKAPVPASALGQIIYVKLVPFDKSGNVPYGLDQVVTYVHVVGGPIGSVTTPGNPSWFSTVDGNTGIDSPITWTGALNWQGMSTTNSGGTAGVAINFTAEISNVSAATSITVVLQRNQVIPGGLGPTAATHTVVFPVPATGSAPIGFTFVDTPSAGVYNYQFYITVSGTAKLSMAYASAMGVRRS